MKTPDPKTPDPKTSDPTIRGLPAANCQLDPTNTLHGSIRRLLAASCTLLVLASPLNARAAGGVIIYFARRSASIDSDSAQALQNLAHRMAADPQAHATVTGYADILGDAAENTRFARQRAQAVIDALIHDGVPAARRSQADGGEASSNGALGENRRAVVSLGP